jgi:hypothetical protein
VTAVKGGIPTPCFLLNLDLIFEDYVRDLLREHLGHARVRDAKRFPPQGERRRLFQDGESSSETEPDIVLVDERSRVRSVFDVKYKAPEKPIERADLNQVLTYALAYDVDMVGIVVPARSTTSAIGRLGTVGGVRVYRVEFDVGSPGRPEAESTFAARVDDLLRTHTSLPMSVVSPSRTT